MSLSVKDILKIATSAAIGSGTAMLLWNYLTKNDNQQRIANTKNNEDDCKSSQHVKDDKNKHLFRYIDEFLSLKCVTDLINHKIYPDAKEITESMSILNALRKYFHSSSKDLQKHKDYNFANKNVTAIIIGDGSTPRIASLLCFVTKWNNIYSIDPQLKINKNKSWKNIKHLKCLRSKIEDITIKVQDVKDNNIVVIFMHSHVLLEQSLLSISNLNNNNFNGKVSLITVPCCQYINKHKTLYDKEADYVFTDVSMATNKNTFYIWKDIDLNLIQSGL